VFKSSEYQNVSLAEWMAHTPHLLMNQHLGVTMSMLDSIPKNRKWLLRPYRDLGPPRQRSAIGRSGDVGCVNGRASHSRNPDDRRANPS
jgi:hypothetical protein